MRARVRMWATWMGLVAAIASARAEPVTYTIRDLGTLGGASSRAYAINEQGWVVGEAETRSGRLHAFLWTPERGMRDLGTLGGQTSRAYGINDRGEVVGEAETEHGEMRPFLWREDSGMEPLSLPPEAWDGLAWSLNNFGVIVGAAETRAGPRALVWTVDGVLIPQPLQEAGESAAYAVNDVGLVAGRKTAPGEIGRGGAPFLLDLINTSTAAVAPIEARNGGAALGINASGTAVGYIEYGAGLQAARFDRAPEPRAVSLDTLNSAYSIAYGINQRGDIVGMFASSPEEDDRAFVWRDGAMLDLNDWLESAEAWHLVEARGINNRGQIVGFGLLRERERAFLLTPGPPALERPRARLVEPANGTAWATRLPLPLRAEIDPPGARVRRILFYANGVLVGSSTAEPYRVMWDKPAPGVQHLVALAVAPDGGTRRSPRITVHVEWDPAIKGGAPQDSHRPGLIE